LTGANSSVLLHQNKNDLVGGKMEKICSQCNEIKEVSEFPTNGKNLDGTFKYRSECKKCNYLRVKEYRKNNPEIRKQQFQRRYNVHREELLLKNKEYYENHIEHFKEYHKQYNNENREIESQKHRDYNSKPENRERRKKVWKEYYEKNKEIILEKSAEYYIRTIEDRRQYRKKNRARLNEYYKNKYKTDPMYRLRVLISSGIRKSLYNGKDGYGWETLVGYTLDDLKSHLESKFDENMNWDNCGSYWHIDHIVPLASFNFASYDDEAFKKCWSLENLQPLYGLDNFRKNDKISEEFGNIELAAQLL
jgi:hypothetical protein